MIEDSGKREEYATGAVRDIRDGKGRYDLLSPFAIMRLAKWVEQGAKKYSDRNWEQGIKISRCMDSCIRHLIKYIAGYDEEDNLAAAMCNLMFIMHFEETKPEMQDFPMRTHK